MNTFLMSGLFLLPVFLTVVRHSMASRDWMQRLPVTGDRMFASSSSLLLPSLRRSTGSSVCSCGHSSDSTHRLAAATHAAVIGGRPSHPTSFPWIAGLLDAYGFNFCAGVLIRRNFVLTAAHCVHNKKARDLSVLVGYTDLDLAYLLNRGQRVAEVIVHPGFVHSNWSHDIALIRLTNERANSQEPICLPTRNERAFDGLVVAGWGRTTPSVNSIKPNKLHEVSLPQVDQDICEKTWAENFVGSDQMCAGAAGRDTCIYDSGSPLMSRRRQTSGHTSTVLAGVTSFGSKRCGDPEKPGVYTRVASYLPWIEFHTRDSEC